MGKESSASVKTKSAWSGLMVLLLFLVIAATLASVYFYLQYQKAKSQTGNASQAAARAEVQQLVHDVGNLMVLPHETPTVATVSDINKLKSQPFFKEANNGDKVLIFPNAKEVILYRPSLKKIIDVSTVNITGSAASPVPSLNPKVSPTSAAVSVEMLNGTSVIGLTSIGEKTLLATDKSATVTDRENAALDTYAKTIVVDMTGGKHAADATQIAAALGGTVGKLPQGETATKSADIVVILGKDFATK